MINRTMHRRILPEIPRPIVLELFLWQSFLLSVDWTGQTAVTLLTLQRLPGTAARNQTDRPRPFLVDRADILTRIEP